VGITWRCQVLVLFVGFLLIASRRPDALLRAQFYAEDGARWYADAYNFGSLSPLLWPYAGYIHLLDRLAAAFVVLLPFHTAPLVLNILAICLQVLPVTFLLSSRCSPWGSVYFRAALAFAYLALPNTMVLHASITEAQWHFALLLALVSLAPAAPNRTWRAFDYSVLVIGGLTGPFSLLLCPCVFAFWYFKRREWQRRVLLILSATSCLQIFFIFRTAGTARSGPPLGANVESFVRIVTAKVYLGAVLGQNALTVNGPIAVWTAVALFGTALVFYCFVNTAFEFRMLILYCTLAFAACLATPLSRKFDTVARWHALEYAGGIHYWLLPMLAFIWSVLWCAHCGRSKTIRIVAVYVLLLGCVGILKDWEYPPSPDLNFKAEAKKLASAAPGTDVVIPLYPPGWEMELRKKP
jgi:hypothetical protein